MQNDFFGFKFNWERIIQENSRLFLLQSEFVLVYVLVSRFIVGISKSNQLFCPQTK